MRENARNGKQRRRSGIAQRHCATSLHGETSVMNVAMGAGKPARSKDHLIWRIDKPSMRQALFNGAIETGNRPRMASGTSGIYEGKQAISIAIATKLHHFLGVSAGGSLMPIFLAAARPKYSLTALLRTAQRLRIHPRHHKHLARRGILHDTRNKAIGIVSQFRDVHYQAPSFDLPRIDYIMHTPCCTRRAMHAPRLIRSILAKTPLAVTVFWRPKRLFWPLRTSKSPSS